MLETIETKRLILRPFVVEDAVSVFENWASDDEVTKYLTWPTHKDINDSRKYMEFCLECYKGKEPYQWGIELKENFELIGNISAVHINEETKSAGLGWVIGKKWWGQGIMPEAAEAVVDYFFETVGLQRVWAEYDTNNPKSGRVMQKIGMQYEGTLRQAGKNNQGIVDLAVYGILKTDKINT